jgi:uncharacterized membrane protein
MTRAASAGEETRTGAVRDGDGQTPTGATRLPLWLFATLAVFLLLVGASRVMSAPYTDAAEYQCYALAFWGGSHAATVPSAKVCAYYLSAAPAAPFHTLPREYGPLALLVFSLPLVGPSALYPWIFAFAMALIVVGLALLLQRVGTVGAGHSWLLYVMLGSMATAAARFDVVPAACTLLALVALRRGRQGWAYAALAAGTLLKLYPALLLPLFLIESWRGRHEKPLWRGPALFAGVVAVVEGCVALLNPAAVLAPLGFLQGRCVQVESLPATLAALGTLLRGHRPAFAYSPQYNSICQMSPGLELFATLCTVLALAGIVGVVALHWRGRLSLGLAACLVLALAMLGSKVFSPQYVLWISPLVAWEYGLAELRAFLGWSLVCLATTLCYPLAYTSLLLVALHTIPDTAVPLTAGLRNALLIALVAVALTEVLRSRPAPDYAARTSPGSPSGG